MASGSLKLWAVANWGEVGRPACGLRCAKADLAIRRSSATSQHPRCAIGGLRIAALVIPDASRPPALNPERDSLEVSRQWPLRRSEERSPTRLTDLRDGSERLGHAWRTR